MWAKLKGGDMSTLREELVETQPVSDPLHNILFRLGNVRQVGVGRRGHVMNRDENHQWAIQEARSC